MSIRLGPYLLLSCLLCVLLFIIGVKYGIFVEKQNKIAAAMPTVTPTQQPQPTAAAPPLEIVKNKANACGVSFLYPSFMTADSSASTEAKLSSPNNVIQFSCDIQSPLFDSVRDTTLPTESITVSGKKITARVQSSTTMHVYIFTVANSVTGKPVAFIIDKTLLPLVTKSLEFSR